jgi:integrase/recombinase XerD
MSQAFTFTESLEVHRRTFLESLRVRSYSQGTLDSYGDALTGFFAFLVRAGIEDVRGVTRDTIQSYQSWIMAQPWTPWTRVARLQGLKRFFEHLETTDTILVNPCLGLTLPKIGRRLPRRVLTEKEVRAILNAPETQTHVGIRDRAILELFYSSGLRRAEMAALTVHDVDGKNGFVRVNQGKGGKDRVVPMGETAAAYVAEYLREVRSEWSKKNREERALWLSSQHHHPPMSIHNIVMLVKKYGRQAGLTGVSPHAWRHSCATHLVAGGANLAYVQRLLGHRSLRTTQVYTRVAVPELKVTHRKTHPRAQRAGSK